MVEIMQDANYQHLKKLSNELKNIDKRESAYLKITGSGKDQHVVVVHGRFWKWIASCASFFGIKKYDLSSISKVLQEQLEAVNTSLSATPRIDDKEIIEVHSTCQELSNFLIRELSREKQQRVIANREKTPAQRDEVVGKTKLAIEGIFEKKRAHFSGGKPKKVKQVTEEYAYDWQWLHEEIKPPTFFLKEHLVENRALFRKTLQIDLASTYELAVRQNENPEEKPEIVAVKAKKGLDEFIKKLFADLEKVGPEGLKGLFLNRPYKSDTLAAHSYNTVKSELLELARRIEEDPSFKTIQEMSKSLQKAYALLVVNGLTQETNVEEIDQAKRYVAYLELKELVKLYLPSVTFPEYTPTMTTREIAKKANEFVSQISQKNKKLNAYTQELQKRIGSLPSDKQAPIEETKPQPPQQQLEEMFAYTLSPVLDTLLVLNNSGLEVPSILFEAKDVKEQIDHIHTYLQDEKVKAYVKELQRTISSLKTVHPIHGALVDATPGSLGQGVTTNTINRVNMCYEMLTTNYPKTAEETMQWIAVLSKLTTTVEEAKSLIGAFESAGMTDMQKLQNKRCLYLLQLRDLFEKAKMCARVQTEKTDLQEKVKPLIVQAESALKDDAVVSSGGFSAEFLASLTDEKLDAMTHAVEQVCDLLQPCWQTSFQDVQKRPIRSLQELLQELQKTKQKIQDFEKNVMTTCTLTALPEKNKEYKDTSGLLHAMYERMNRVLQTSTTFREKEARYWEIEALRQAEGVDAVDRERTMQAKRARLLLELREVVAQAEEHVQKNKKNASSAKEKQTFDTVEKSTKRLRQALAKSEDVFASDSFSQKRMSTISTLELKELRRSVFDAVEPLRTSPSIDKQRKWPQLQRYRRESERHLLELK